MKINQLKAGVALSYSSTFLGYLISILYTPIMLRLLGQSEYGLYNLVSSLVSYLGLLSFGFGSAYMRYYSRYKVKNDDQNISKLNGMFLLIFSAMGVVAIIAGIILVFNINLILGSKLIASELVTAKVLMGIMVFNLAISFPTSVFNSYVTANEEYIFQKILLLIKTVVSPFVMLPVLLLGYKSIGMVVATTVLSLIAEIINVIFCFKNLKIKFLFKQFDFSLMREMTAFSSYIFINMIVDQINWNVDKLIIGRYRGTIAVAVYGIAAQLNNYYVSLSTTFSSVFIPQVNRMIVLDNNDDKELTIFFTKIGRIQFILMSLIGSGLIFFGKQFINLWAGADYKEAYPIALLLIIPVTIPSIQNIGLEIQKAKNMHKFRSWVYLFIAIVNVSLSIPLTKKYGGIGAAFGTAIGILLGNGILMNWYYDKRIGIDMRYFWYQIIRFLPALIVPIIVGISLNLFIDLYNIVSFILCGTLYVVIFCFSMWFLGMNQYEKYLIGEPILKILKKVLRRK